MNYKSVVVILLVIILLLFAFIFLPIQFGESIVVKQNEIWSHRNNTIEKAITMSEKFDGIELDVVYDSGLKKFDIRHEEFEPSSNLNLFSLIDSTLQNKKKYWIDLKNLDETTAYPVLKLFNNYIALHPELKSRIIIESHNPSSLNILSQSGYFTSYWVPHYSNNFIGYMKFFVRTKFNLIRYKFSALSAQRSMLPMLSFFYPSHHFHIWTDDLDLPENVKVVKDISKNKSVKVILVDFTAVPDTIY